MCVCVRVCVCVHAHVCVCVCVCVCDRPGLWLIQGVEVLTQSGDDALVLVGVLAEDVLQIDMTS